MNATPRLPKTAWYAIRWSVLDRDAFTCQYCGQYAPNVMLEVDHRVAICEGGSNELENLVTACSACNRGKEGYRAAVNGRSPEVPETETLAGSIRSALAVASTPLSAYDIAALLDADANTVSRTLRRIPDAIRTNTGRGRGVIALWTLADKPERVRE